jgi:hypothetical protein
MSRKGYQSVPDRNCRQACSTIINIVLGIEFTEFDQARAWLSTGQRCQRNQFITAHTERVGGADSRRLGNLYHIEVKTPADTPGITRSE